MNCSQNLKEKPNMLMRNLRNGLAAIAIAGFGAGCTTNQIDTAITLLPGSEATCQEDCLTDIFNAYQKALLAHDPSQLPALSNVRFTENTVELPLGDGLWKTISGAKSYTHFIPDVQGGQIGFFTTIEEQGKGALLAGRLQIRRDGLISEIETIVVRGADMGAFLNTDQTAPAAGFTELALEGALMPRSEIARIADRYFDGLEEDTGEIVPFHEECRRTENGIQTAGEGTQSNSSLPTGCKAQINTRAFSYISSINPRRFEVIDRKRGVVMAFAMFHHDGTLTHIDIPGHGQVPVLPAALRPFTVIVAEAFEIKDGQIREIESAMTSLPYGSGSGWD